MMVISEIISHDILPLQPSDTGNTALSWMEELRVSHLPVVLHDNYWGLISDKEIYLMNDTSQSLTTFNHAFGRPYVFAHQHIYDIFRLISTVDISVIPVLDENENYQGSILQSDLMKHIAQCCSLSQPGSIVVLEMNLVDYSLTEISRIVESNDAKILHAGIKSFDNSNKIEVTLKLNKIDISSVIQTFNRYEAVTWYSYRLKV
jgi:CBS domain-containing protein